MRTRVLLVLAVIHCCAVPAAGFVDPVVALGVREQDRAARHGQAHTAPRLHLCPSLQMASKLRGSPEHFRTFSMGMSRAGTPDTRLEIFSETYANKVAGLGDTAIVEMLPANSPSSPPLRQEMFSSPVIPLLYERVLPPVWAAGLRVGGMDEEFAEVGSFLQGDGSGTVLDLSCGTGFIARRLAASRQFQHVIALDYSTEMLQQLISELQQQRRGWNPPAIPAGALSVVRGDAGNLPLRAESVDAVHWGAAMHCVPDAEAGLREAMRVLRPGGKLYATTFLRPLPDLVFRFFTLPELEAMAYAAGFGRGDGAVVEVRRLGPVYGVLRVVKGR